MTKKLLVRVVRAAPVVLLRIPRLQVARGAQALVVLLQVAQVHRPLTDLAAAVVVHPCLYE